MEPARTQLARHVPAQAARCSPRGAAAPSYLRGGRGALARAPPALRPRPARAAADALFAQFEIMTHLHQSDVTRDEGAIKIFTTYGKGSGFNASAWVPKGAPESLNAGVNVWNHGAKCRPVRRNARRAAGGGGRC
ncbi:hypothetical protein EVAR_47461_1 [Eumeta japonica]|uniref:Uncharacterized protein n=1 Tax=Eumeta variegata TaxID=151549 RepID=A0A4C1XBZ7_EUMVA|nr:hypothetical protein EVAR_47461_1 [Eumeta japonica]